MAPLPKTNHMIRLCPVARISRRSLRILVIRIQIRFRLTLWVSKRRHVRYVIEIRFVRFKMQSRMASVLTKGNFAWLAGSLVVMSSSGSRQTISLIIASVIPRATSSIKRSTLKSNGWLMLRRLVGEFFRELKDKDRHKMDSVNRVVVHSIETSTKAWALTKTKVNLISAVPTASTVTPGKTWRITLLVSQRPTH